MSLTTGIIIALARGGIVGIAWAWCAVGGMADDELEAFDKKPDVQDGGEKKAAARKEGVE